MWKKLMTFSSLDDVIKLFVFNQLLQKLSLLKFVLCPEKVITDKIQWYPELANELRIYFLFFILFIENLTLLSKH